MVRSDSRRRLVVIDCETTGLNPLQDRILELAVAEFPEGLFGKEPVVLHNWSFKVDRESTDEAYAVHGIASSDQIDCPEFEEVIHDIDDLLLQREYEDEPPLVAGHRVGFDLDFIREEYVSAGYSPPVISDVLDTRAAGHYYLDKGASLDAMLEHFNVPGRKYDHHEAGEDVELTAKLLYKLSLALEIGPLTAIAKETYPAAFKPFETEEEEMRFAAEEVARAGELMLSEMGVLVGSRDGEEGSHGSFRSNADIAQDIKDVYRKHEGFFKLTKQEREALDNIAIKQCRIISAPVSQDLDSWTDIGGYAFLGRRYRAERNEGKA